MPNYLIDFTNNASQSEITSYITENNCSILKTFSRFQNVYLVESEAVPPTTNIVETIQADDSSTVLNLLEVINVPQNISSGTATVYVQENKDWWKSYSITEIDFDSQQLELPIFGANSAVVYIMDSGINHNHPEFSGRQISLLHSFTGDFTDTTGHGTALASLIAGQTCAVSDPHLKIVKIFDSSQPTYQSDLLTALNAVIDDATTISNKLKIVNMSWGIPKNTYIESKIRLMIDAGLLLVAAAGNNGSPIENVTPASMGEVITVGAYNEDFLPCNFSNYTNPIDTSLTNNETNYGILDVWSPGDKIYCAKPDGTYGWTAGTSAAAAICSASMAYNSVFNMDWSGTIFPWLLTNNGNPSNQAFLSAERTGLLDLSDPKYSSSVNKIITFLNSHAVWDQNVSWPIKMVARVGELRTSPLFHSSLTASYEFTGPLPSEITVLRDVVVFTPTTEVTDPSGVERNIYNYKIYEKDGNVIENTLEIVKLGTDFNESSLPQNDPLLDIVAFDTCFGQSPGTICNGPCPQAPAIYCYTQSKFYCGCRVFSDEQLKENISDLDNPIDMISKIKGVRFNWKKEYHSKISAEGNNALLDDFGLLAGNIESIFPQLVEKDSDGHRFVHYYKLIPLLVEGIKSQQSEIRELKETVKNLTKE